MQACISGEHSQSRIMRGIIDGPKRRSSHATTATAVTIATIPPNAPAHIARFADTPFPEREQLRSQPQLESTLAVMCRLPLAPAAAHVPPP
jgi:hypothetical protein